MSLADTIRGCGRILNDEFSDVSERALYMIGRVEEAEAVPGEDSPENEPTEPAQA